jgi:hypothetical protein
MGCINVCAEETVTPQAYADLLTLAQSAYDAYYPQWLHDDSPEQVIAKVAVAMGVIGCEATFSARKDVAREVIEKGVCDAIDSPNAS